MRKSVSMLMVDADEQYRMAIEDLFEEDGYEIIGCADATIALDIFQTLRQPAVFVIGDAMLHPIGPTIVAALARHPADRQGCAIIYLAEPYQALDPEFRAQLWRLGIPMLSKSLPLAKVHELVEEIAQPLEQEAALVAGGKGDPPYRI